MTAPSTGHSLRYWQWRSLLCVMGVYLFYYTGRMVIGHAIPLMEDDLGYSSEQLGWLTFALLIAYGVGQAINGNLGDFLGGRRMMAMGALLSMVFCWAFSYMTLFGLLVVFWAANGYVQSMGWAPGSRLISNWWPRRERGTAFGLYVLAAGFATMLVWVTSHAVLSVAGEGDPSRWRWLFRIPLLMLGLAGVIFYVLVRERPQDVGHPAIADDPQEAEEAVRAAEEGERGLVSAVRRYRLVFGHWRFLVACAIILLQNFARYGLLTWMVKYYRDVANIDLKASLVVTFTLPLGMALGGFSAGTVSDKVFGSRRYVSIFCFLAAGAVTAIAVREAPATNRGLGLVLMFLVGFFVYGAQAPLWALCPDLVGRENAGTAVGVMDAAAYAGAAIQGPLLGSFIDRPETLGYPAVFMTLAAACGAGAVLALVVRR